MQNTKFGKDDIKNIFLTLCESFLTSSSILVGVKYILIGTSMFKEEAPAVVPILAPNAEPEFLKKEIERIIEESGKQIRFTNILCFDIKKNEVKGSIEEIGDGIIFQQIFKNVCNVEDFSDNSYQIFN